MANPVVRGWHRQVDVLIGLGCAGRLVSACGPPGLAEPSQGSLGTSLLRLRSHTNSGLHCATGHGRVLARDEGKSGQLPLRLGRAKAVQ